MRVLRLLRIISLALRYGLDEILLGHQRTRRLRPVFNVLLFWRDLSRPRAQRIRLALEALGPIFVKFGQVLSTRRDVLATDIADELAKLQDQVPPFPPEQAIATLERVYGRKLDQVFRSFEPSAAASASVAQVHFAELPDGKSVAVKILRPKIEATINKDVALLHSFAALVEKISSDGRRLRPREVVAEFEKHLADELDLMREAANCSQLRRNFLHSPLLKVPEVYWDYCSTEVMVMERMYGTPISQVDVLRAQGIDIPQLARNGVEIFFTQVFRDGFFHADMHPGNIFVSAEGKYIALDFGIMGSLSKRDKNYLARNFLAFFNRDYQAVAIAHLESGWVPKDSREEELAAAVRTVCEPIFARPLKDISLANILVRLFQLSRRFNVEVQPQLVMLQKTLLNVEGLGRQLDPELDLWTSAKPFLERWMAQQIGWPAFERHLKEEAPHWAAALPQLPRMLSESLRQSAAQRSEQATINEAARVKRWLALIAVLLIAILLSLWLQ